MNVTSLPLENSSHKKKVIVALSGGVDSAVSAALLAKQGFQVLGVFFRFFDGADAKKSLNKAKKIAKKLAIPLKIVDAQKEFQKKIIDCFVESYKKGITPNPCVVCNREMKFDLLFSLLKKYKADYVATGHYALIKARSSIQGSTFSLSAKASNSSRSSLIEIPQGQALCEARDKKKDQSYFLYRLTQQELAKIIFPLGEFKKTETKKMAKKFGLPVLGEEESQDICFLWDLDINSFLKKYIKPKCGNIVDEKGNVIARHRGLPFYTIGQRKGIEIGGTGPYFVIGKNAGKKELIVSNDPRKLLTKKLEINQISWTEKPKKFPVLAQVRIRYHSEKFPAIIRSGKSGKLSIETKKTLRAVTPGQSAVFYQKEAILGGGIIV